MERRRGNRGRGRGGFRSRGGARGRGGGRAQAPKISFTHFFAVPLWDCVKPQFRDRQTKFEAFIREKYPEFIGTYKF